MRKCLCVHMYISISKLYIINLSLPANECAENFSIIPEMTGASPGR